MLRAALRVLIWRRRRVVITMLATALVLAMSLVMSGLADAFPNEVDRVLTRLGPATYLSPAGSPGPSLSTALAAESAAPDASLVGRWSP